MSKTARRTAIERAEAKNARAYVEEVRRRTQAGLQETVTNRLNDLIDEEATRTARRREQRAHIYTACWILGGVAIAFFISPPVIALAIYLTHQP